MKIANIVNIILNIYFAIMITYIFATWIPKVDWEKPPWLFLKKIANLYLGIFEKIIPGWGSIIGIIIFRLMQEAILKFLV